MAIRYRSRYATRNDEIIAELRALAGAAAPPDPAMIVKRKTAEVAIAMALLHGGEWRVQIDHDVGLVVVAKAPPQTLSRTG